MNPGNGIETFYPTAGRLRHVAFKLMNPDNGIETPHISIKLNPHAFKLMNPGNGIETFALHWVRGRRTSFKLMNPGNGIETFHGCRVRSKL